MQSIRVIIYHYRRSKYSNQHRKNIKTKENIIESRLHYSNVIDDLIYGLQNVPTICNPNLISVIEAKTQADHVITYQSKYGNCDGALADDGDFIMMGGEDMLLIKKFSFDKRGQNKSRPTNFTLASSHLSPLKDSWCTILKKPFTDINIPEDGFNLLETDDPYLRAVIAIGTGCDVIPKGVKSIGIKTVKKFIDEEGPDYEKILHRYSENNDYDKDVLFAYLSCIIFETGDIVSNESTVHPKYLHSKPTCLPAYCKEFSSTDTTIDESLSLLKCQGYVKGTHTFMEKEGSVLCSQCSKVLCPLCIANVNQKMMNFDIKDNLCLACYDLRINGLEEQPSTYLSMT